MGWIAEDKRAALYTRGGDRCVYCETETIRGAHTSILNAATLDHIKPRNHGGSHHATNLACCCARCNSRRGDTPLRSWAAQHARERAEAAVPGDADCRPEVVEEMAARLADEIIRRVRNETRRQWRK